MCRRRPAGPARSREGEKISFGRNECAIVGVQMSGRMIRKRSRGKRLGSKKSCREPNFTLGSPEHELATLTFSPSGDIGNAANGRRMNHQTQAIIQPTSRSCNQSHSVATEVLPQDLHPQLPSLPPPPPPPPLPPVTADLTADDVLPAQNKKAKLNELRESGDLSTLSIPNDSPPPTQSTSPLGDDTGTSLFIRSSC